MPRSAPASPFRARFTGLPAALFAAALVVFAALLPGLHGLSLGPQACDNGSCTDSACASDQPDSEAVAVVHRPRHSCPCGHDHTPKSPEGPPSVTGADSDTRDGRPSPGDEPGPAPQPHDHHNCPVCKVIFTGAHRFAVSIAANWILAPAESLDTPLQSTLTAPRLVQWDSARPRGPPASPRA